MKTVSIDVVKRNRKYFACRVNGYKAKLVIDSNSETLEIGKHELIVNDISKRTKYGTDVIFELASPADEQKEAGIVTLSHHLYNSDLVYLCRDLGGRWDAESKTWVFSELVEDRVEEIDDLYNCDLVPVEIRAKDDISEWHAPVTFLGYTIAKAWGRDSGAKLGDDISKMSGGVHSGGSVKNWTTRILGNSIFRLKVPSKLLDMNFEKASEEWEIKRLEE